MNTVAINICVKNAEVQHFARMESEKIDASTAAARLFVHTGRGRPGVTRVEDPKYANMVETNMHVKSAVAQGYVSTEN